MIMSNATSENTTVNDRPAPKGESLVDALLDIGAAWAAHGLKVGKLALETSAMTLGKTARTLDRLADELDRTKGDAAIVAPAPAEEVPADETPAA
jgi:hypothetical protein